MILIKSESGVSILSLEAHFVSAAKSVLPRSLNSDQYRAIAEMNELVKQGSWNGRIHELAESIGLTIERKTT